MNIAIVDDEKIELETAETFLRLYIKKFWAKYESLINIETFYNADDFFCPKFYQIVILGGHMKDFADLIASNSNNDTKIFLISDDCGAELQTKKTNSL